MILEEGHLRGARRVTVPVGAVTRIDGEGVRVSLTRSQVDALTDQGEPPDLPADKQLRDLPHRRDAAVAAVRHPAILVFNFFPVTAIMIVILALLNDAAILSIAYDNVHYRDAPEAWNMRLVLGIATVPRRRRPDRGVRPVLPRDRVFDLGRPELQTMMYLDPASDSPAQDPSLTGPASA